MKALPAILARFKIYTDENTTPKSKTVQKSRSHHAIISLWICQNIFKTVTLQPSVIYFTFTYASPLIAAAR